MNIHQNSLSAFQVEMLSKETKASLGHATAFLVSLKGEVFIVTNYHVAAGKKPGTNLVIHESGAVPGYLKFTLSVVEYTNREQGMTINSEMKIEMQILDCEGRPFWREHPEGGSEVDVVTLPLPSSILSALEPNQELVPIDLNRALEYENRLAVMDELFITGFPIRQDLSLSKYPIYKSGYLASEPDDLQGGAKFFVDSRTKPGMSGSPVIQKERMKIIKTPKGGLSATDGRVNFIGIYSGRMGSTDRAYEAELGVVWPFREYLLPMIEAYLKECK